MQSSIRARRLLALVARIEYETTWLGMMHAAEPSVLRVPQSADYSTPEAAIEIER